MSEARCKTRASRGEIELLSNVRCRASINLDDRPRRRGALSPRLVRASMSSFRHRRWTLSVRYVPRSQGTVAVSGGNRAQPGTGPTSMHRCTAVRRAWTRDRRLNVPRQRCDSRITESGFALSGQRTADSRNAKCASQAMSCVPTMGRWSDLGPRFREDVAQNLLHLVELGLATDQWGSDLDDGFAAIVGTTVEAVLEQGA